MQRDPRLVLVARSFAPRTAEALEFLLQHHLPVQVLKVAFYIDDTGRRFLDVEWESEPEAVPHAGSAAPTASGDTSADTIDFREVTLAEVATAVGTPSALTWSRPRKGTSYSATLLEGRVIRLDDGREFRSPSGAAMAAADVVSYDGWYAWRTEDGKSLNDHRHSIANAQTAASEAASTTADLISAGGAHDDGSTLDAHVASSPSGHGQVGTP